jgi:hypothetical protein
MRSDSLFSEGPEKSGERFGKTIPVVCVFCHFSPHFCVEREQNGGEELRFVQKHPAFGGVEGVDALSRDHALNLTLLLRKSYKKPGAWTGFPRPPGNEKGPNFKESFWGSGRFSKCHNLPTL